jgi:hypothetical protein
MTLFALLVLHVVNFNRFALPLPLGTKELDQFVAVDKAAFPGEEMDRQPPPA